MLLGLTRDHWSCLRIHPWTTQEHSGCLELACYYELVPSTETESIRWREVYSFLRPDGSMADAEVQIRRDEVLARLFDELTVAASLSYWKAWAPPVIEIALPLSAASVEFHRTLLAEGMGEFAFVNGLDPSTDLRPEFRVTSLVTAPDREMAPVAGLALDRGPLVPVGGGKDSCVTIEALRACGQSPTLVTVRRYPVIQHVIDDAGLDDVAVGRVLDPALIAANSTPGVMNGHVPVTAIVSLAATAAALLGGHDAVLLSNERSASVPNVLYRGAAINHQWSKSAEAEAGLADLVARITPELRVFSLLRGCSELSIVANFVRLGLDRYRESFSSCNAAFRIDEQRRVRRWCRQCPKCQFVGLALAAFVGPDELAAIQGGDVFRESDPAGFRELLGLAAWKPFECVGDDVECRAALALAWRNEDWRAHPVLSEFAAELRANDQWADDAAVDDVMRQQDPPLVPARYRAALKVLNEAGL